MKVKFQTKILQVINSVKKRKNILKNHTLIGLGLTLLSIGAASVLTGLLYVRNEAVIYDGGVTMRVFTMYDEVDKILDEHDIALSEYDRVDFEAVAEGEAAITIHRALNLPVNSDGETVAYVQCAYDERVGDVAERSGVELTQYDFVGPDADALCKDVTEITISKAYPVTVMVDGDKVELMTANQTVEQLLARAGVVLKEDDFVNYELDQIVTDDMTIEVTRVRYVERQTVELIPYETVIEKDNLLAIGYSKVTTEGENGKRVNTSLEKYVNGVKVSETAVSSEITKEPVNEVITKGAALVEPYSKRDSEIVELENGIPVNYEYVLTGKSTAYTARAGSGTYSGRTLEIGTVAVDPNIIPFGSELYIVSSDGSYVYGYAVAADTGDLTAHGVLVDLYMGLSSEAYGYSCWYGARQVDVYVLGVATR